MLALVFKKEIIAKLPGNAATISVEFIREWITMKVSEKKQEILWFDEHGTF